MKYSEIKKAVNEKLKALYPDIPRYGKEVADGYSHPCFFPYILPKGSRADTKNFASGGFTVKITYMQDVKDEADMLEKYDCIAEGFGMFLQVGERKILAGEKSFEYVGKKADILQISIEYDYKENIHVDDDAEVAQSVTFNFKERKK